MTDDQDEPDKPADEAKPVTEPPPAAPEQPAAPAPPVVAAVAGAAEPSKKQKKSRRSKRTPVAVDAAAPTTPTPDPDSVPVEVRPSPPIDETPAAAATEKPKETIEVRCAKCDTDYTLDQARIKPTGLTVKCTNCGHTFKIFKPGTQPDVAQPPTIEPKPDPVEPGEIKAIDAAPTEPPTAPPVEIVAPPEPPAPERERRSSAPPATELAPASEPASDDDRRIGPGRRRSDAASALDFEAATLPEPEPVTASPVAPPQPMLLDPAAAAFEAARIAGEIVGDIESASGAAIVAAAAAGAAIEATRARMAAGAPAEIDPLAVVAAATAAVNAQVAPGEGGAHHAALPAMAEGSIPNDPITTVRMQRERILRALADDIAHSPEVTETASNNAAATTSASSAAATASPALARSPSQGDALDDNDVTDPVQLAAAAIQRLRSRASTNVAELRGHYHRHDAFVLLAAFIIIVIAGRVHTGIVTPPTALFPHKNDQKAQRGLTFDYPRGWLKAETINAWPPRIVRDPSGQPPKVADAYHVSITSSIDGSTRIEVLIEPKPAWSNTVSSLELDRRTRWGELYAVDEISFESIGDQDWLRTEYRYAHAPQKGDLPRVDHAIEYATTDLKQIYVVTLFGTPTALDELEDVVAPSLRIAAGAGTRSAQQFGSRTRTPEMRKHPRPVATALDSTVNIVVADLIDGRLVARGGGSGVIVGGDGSVLTNYHVIRDKNGRLHDVFVIGRSEEVDAAPQLVCAGRPNRSKLQPELDLALIKCDTDLDGRTWTPKKVPHIMWPTLAAAKAQDVKIGQRIWVLGYPDTSRGWLSLSQGTIDGWTGQDGREGRDFIKVDAAISLGNSGGPVVDDQGRLVGIASFLRTRITGGGATTSQEKLVRPISTASDLLAIATIGWTPRDNQTSVEIQPSDVEPVIEGVRIETHVIDAANGAPVRDALVMVIKPDVDQTSIDVNRIGEQVVAWGRSNAQGEVKLNQPVPVGTYTVLVRATGYDPLIGEDKLRIDETTPPRYDPWTHIKIAR